MNRRQFLEALSLSSLGFMALPSLVRADEEDIASALFPVPTNTGISGTIVIVGGGMAGVTLAKYLRLWGGTGVKVTLIEKAPSYTSNIMSNKVLTGQMTLADLNYVYDTLKNHYGVQVVSGTVTGIDSGDQTVALAGGASYGYDRLVLAPGLEFDLLPGMSSLTQYDQLIPHAWQAGPQTQLLRNQLVSMANGADVVITIPKAPYRCPPGPYERACVVADWLATNKPASQVVVLDANAGILVERDNFAAAFNGAHGYTVDYRSGCEKLNIESVTNRTVSYVDVKGKKQILTAGVLNPIPPQRAPQWLADAGLYDPDRGERSVPVNVLSYESTQVPLGPCHRRRQLDYPAQGRAHWQPTGEDLRGRHPPLAAKPAPGSGSGHQFGLLHADHGDDRHLALGGLSIRRQDRDHVHSEPAQRWRRHQHE
jgi:sulfide dehydrogenase [flavocytochrome c] flavoprotein subunit